MLEASSVQKALERLAFGELRSMLETQQTAWRVRPSSIVQDPLPEVQTRIVQLDVPPQAVSLVATASERGTALHRAMRVLLLRPDLRPRLSAATGFEEATLDVLQAQADALNARFAGVATHEMLAALHVPDSVLPRVFPSSHVYGETTLFGAPIPIAGIAGDQQAALFGQACFSEGLAKSLGFYRIAPAVTLFATFYIIFLALTPSRYRTIECRKWPGAALVTLWWIGTATLLPKAISLAGGYDLTYGSLAGVMIALFFFWLVGLGMVAGAELNAALAEPPEERDTVGQADNRARAAQTGKTRSENESA